MIARYRLKSVPLQEMRPGVSLSRNHFIGVTNDGGGIAQALAKALGAKHYQVEVCDKIPSHCDVAILLEGLKSHRNIEDAIGANFDVFYQAKNIADRFANKGGLLITLQETGGHFGLTQMPPYKAWTGGIAALSKTAQREWPHATCRAIDFNRDGKHLDLIVQQLTSEIFAMGRPECGVLATGERISLELEETLHDQELRLPLNPGSVLVVTGGARGITAACLLGLAKLIPLNLIILGRSLLADSANEYALLDRDSIQKKLINGYQQKKIDFTPKELNDETARILAQQETAHTMKKLRALGSEVLYLNVDVTDRDQVNHALTKGRKQFGAIHGIIHGAGTIIDRTIRQQTMEQFKTIFHTKVHGLQNLLQATKNDSVKLIALFSSVVARFGNASQVAYAMANEVMNKVAQDEHHRRGSACLVKSFNWGPWEFGMVRPELKRIFVKRGMPLIDQKMGVNFFIQALNLANHDDVELVFGAPLPSG